MYEYKNVSKQELVLPNIGVVPAGAIIKSHAPIENPNLQQTQGAPAQNLQAVVPPRTDSVMDTPAVPEKQEDNQ